MTIAEHMPESRSGDPMSASKKNIRSAFRHAVFRRARYRCQGPGCNVAVPEIAVDLHLDAHHITSREALPRGGYVAENGIALCRAPGGCHEKAEQFYVTGVAVPGFVPNDLYKIIGSDRAKAEAESRKLA